MDRRRFLALCATSAALAGCSVSPGTTDARTTESGVPGGSGTASSGASSGSETATTPDLGPIDGGWEGYRHDAGHTAATDDSGPTDSPATAWQYATATGTPATGPAAGDGAFFVATDANVLYAREAADGSIRWRTTFGSGGVQSSPVVAGGRVFVNAGNSVRALDATDGSEHWSRSTGGSNQPPAVHDGTVYTPGNGEVHALDAADGTREWRAQAGESLALAVGDGTVYGVGFDTTLLALDGSDGSELWRHPGFEMGSSPAIAEEVLFVGDSTGRLHALGPGPG